MRASAFLLALLLLAGGAAAEVSLGPTEVLELVCGVGPPGLEPHPFDSSVAFVACSSEDPGASSIRIAPDAPMAFAGVDYFLPGDLNCSESLANCGNPTGFSFGSVGKLRLDPDLEGTLLARGWVTTTNCELVVPFDAISGGEWPLLYQGGDRDSVPTKRCISGDYTTYADAGLGSSVDAFATNLTSDVLRVGSRLLVSTANFSRAGSNPILFPGTVLLFDIDDSGPQTRVTPASPPFIVTSDPNPTALSPLPGGLVAVTNTGLLDVAFPPLVTGVGSIDIIDPAAGALLGSIPLGAGNPGGRSLALDPNGSIAVLGSSTLRALFAVDIRGLASLPPAEIDPRLQRPSCNGSDEDEAGGLPCLRRRVIHDFAAPLLLPPRPGASGSAGFVVEVRFSASGDFIAATSFNDGGIGLVAFDSRNLDRPHPYLPSRFGAPETLAATPPSGQFGDECCP